MLHQGIQAAGGLVQDQQFRVVLQSTDDADFFPVAEGKVLHLPVYVKLQPLAQFRGGSGAVLFPEVRGQLQDFPDLHPAIKSGVRRQISNPLQDCAAVFFNIQAEHLRLAGGRRDQAQQGPDRGGFAGAVRPDETEEVPGFHFQIQAVDSPGLAVILGQGGGCNCFGSHNFPLSRVSFLRSPLYTGLRNKKRRNRAGCPGLFLQIRKIDFQVFFASSQASAWTDCWNCPPKSIASISSAVYVSTRRSSMASSSWPVTFRQFSAAKR